MMFNKKQLGKTTLTLLLLVALMLPTVVQFIHAFEAHEHVVSIEKQNHFHKAEKKCDTCSFQLTVCNYNTDFYNGLTIKRNFVKTNLHFNPLEMHAFSIADTKLRAPPIYS